MASTAQQDAALLALPTFDLTLPPIDPEDQNPVWDYDITLGDREFRLVLRYNSRMDGWYLDLYAGDGDPLILGKRLVTTNWSQAFKPMIQDERWTRQEFPPEVPNQEGAARNLFILDIDATESEPTYDSLGQNHLLWYATTWDLQFYLIINDALPPEFDFDGTRVVDVQILP